ncbi:MAG: hypothetical protein ACXAEF_14780 [Candidatus Thorarchaeota archaeon]|jgi:hypothetical protein
MTLTKGALVEYEIGMVGPLPNVVLFQFNPETLNRSFEIPARNIEEESNQAGKAPVESISFTAIFNAAESLNLNNPIARKYGIGPQLAALELMIYPTTSLSETAGGAGSGVDSIGDQISAGIQKLTRGTPIPRLSYPRILFIWGQKRLLPVIIQSMKITEEQYDANLNPISAKVDITLSIQSTRDIQLDLVAKGAIDYSRMEKDIQAKVNLANTLAELPDYILSQVEDIINF